MIDIRIEKIIDEVSKDKVSIGVDRDIVHRACLSEFAFVVNKMREYKETHENAPIRLNLFGTFMVNPNRAKYIEKDDRE